MLLSTHVKILLEICSWIFTIFAIWGAHENAHPKAQCDLLKTNTLYSIANLYNFLYFALTLQYALLVRECFFCYFSLKGIHQQSKQQTKQTNPCDPNDIKP